MKATQLEHGFFQAAIFKLTQELGEQGGEIITRVNNDDTFRKRVAKYMVIGAPSLNPQDRPADVLTYDVAKAIMGENYIIGPDVVQRVLGITIDTKDLEKADIIPYRITTLARHSRSHLLVYGYPISIRDVYKKTQRRSLRWKLPEGNGEVVVASSPAKGWFLLSRHVEDLELSPGERLATVAELMYSLSLYQTQRTHNYLFSSVNNRDYGLCTETADGGEAYFGLGRAFLGALYGDGDHDYTVIKDPDIKPPHTIRVVLPDNAIAEPVKRVPSDKATVNAARETLETIRILVTDPKNCPSRRIQHNIDWIREKVKAGELTLDEAGTTNEELEDISTSAFNAREGN